MQSSPQLLKTLIPGQIITIYICKYKYLLAAVLQITPKRGQELCLTVLVLCNREDDGEARAQSLVDMTEKYLKNVHIFEPLNVLYLPESPSKHAVINIPSQLLINITEETIKMDPQTIISDYRKRQIPRFQ